MTSGQMNSLARSLIGLALTIGGFLSGNPAVGAIGIGMVAQGFALGLAEAMGGDISGIPSEVAIAGSIIDGINNGDFPSRVETIGNSCR